MIKKISFYESPHRTIEKKNSDYSEIEKMNDKISKEIKVIESKISKLNFEKESIIKQYEHTGKDLKQIKKRLNYINKKIEEYSKKLEEKDNFICHLFYDYHERL